MLGSASDVVRVGTTLYGETLPPPLPLIAAALAVKEGGDASSLARLARTTRKRLEATAAASDPVALVLGCDLATAAEPAALDRPRALMGQLLLGELAERAFVRIYTAAMGVTDLKLEDDRVSRNETDYRVLNGSARPVFRINIKFFGTAFRKARELVGLDSDDCFALATYKIYQGLQKQDVEHLPYVFMIVGVAGLTGTIVGQVIPDDFAHFVSLVHLSRRVPGKRAVEERVIAYLLDESGDTAMVRQLEAFGQQIESANWFALSARRADNLLREKLFDRVYAVRVRAFARNYRNAELDMHFSLRSDLTPLSEFLRNARERGLHGLAVDLERGVV